MLKFKLSFLVLIFTFGLVSVSPLLAQQDINVKLSTGFDHTVGNYGRFQDTEILYIPFIAKATRGNWTAKLVVPYIMIKGPGNVLGGEDGVVIDDDDPIAVSNAVTTESGLGDILGSVTYTHYIDSQDLYLDFTGKIKFPTADEDKRLGTGEPDYTIQFDATKMFGSLYIFGGVGRRFVGDPPQFPLDDIWLLNVGGGYQIDKKLGLGLAYDFREAASAAEDPSEATAYFTYKVTDALTAMVYGVIGFSDGSPDAGMGLQFGYKFDLLGERTP